MGAVAIRRDLAVLRAEPERERVRVAGRRGDPEVVSSGGVGTVRISFVLTFWSSRPLWASHSRFGALSLTF